MYDIELIKKLMHASALTLNYSNTINLSIQQIFLISFVMRKQLEYKNKYHDKVKNKLLPDELAAIESIIKLTKESALNKVIFPLEEIKTQCGFLLKYNSEDIIKSAKNMYDIITIKSTTPSYIISEKKYNDLLDTLCTASQPIYQVNEYRHLLKWFKRIKCN